jgi:hypothetical protein
MAWRRPVQPPRIEPPLWYRAYDPASWDVPDGHELSMTGGRDVRDWPGHEIHARRRWQEAKHAYRRAHPALATQEFDDLIEGRNCV